MYYALCNGKEFVLYHVSEYEPLLHFKTEHLPFYWADLKRLLSPDQLLSNCDKYNKLNKDFGLHLKRLGFESFKRLHFLQVPVISLSKLDNDLHTFATTIKQEDDYCFSFDFNHNTFLNMKGKIPDEAFFKLIEPVTDSITQVRFVHMRYYVNIRCELGTSLEENRDEIFMPLIINEFL